MRTYGILLILGLILVSIALVARTGLFRRAHPGEPANKYTRQMMEQQELSPDEQRLIHERYANAIITPSGLRYVVEREGTGEPPSRGAEISAHYEGTLLANGEKFDSSYDRGEPYRFRVGTGRVIAGWDEAFLTMRTGEKRVLIIPWWLAYGADGRGPIPPHATLVFRVELVATR